MDTHNTDSLIKPMTSSENIIKPVPKPFSIEALMSDDGPKRTSTPNVWTSIQTYNHHPHISRDTDSEGSLDLELAQDLSRRSERDSKYFNNINNYYGHVGILQLTF